MQFDEVESHYRRSPFIGEVCVFTASAGAERTGGLHAVVVPDAVVLRERRIVNVRELIRFELEGLSIALPARERVVAFDVTLEPLPRHADGTPDRDAIEERYRAGRLRVPPDADAAAAMDDHLAGVVALIQALVSPEVVVRPWSNLELDLGLDSMDRVELVATLERRFGTRIADAVAQRAFTVRDLAEAFRGAAPRSSTPAPDPADSPWAAMLDADTPGLELRGLLKPRLFTALVVYGLVRMVVGALVRPKVSGREHLPRKGPFIITPNHQSYIDPLVLECVLPFGVFRQLFFVGAAEYFETPLTTRLARALNIVPVDPDANLLPAMQAGAFGLKHGKVLVLFPEGERSIDGTVREFRKGAAILSQHTGAPIVPVAINGMLEIWPRSRPLRWRRLLPWSGHRVTVRFGPPVGVPAPRTTYAEHIGAVRGAVEAMWIESTGPDP